MSPALSAGRGRPVLYPNPKSRQWRWNASGPTRRASFAVPMFEEWRMISSSVSES